MACKFRYGDRIKLAFRALNRCLAPRWWCKVALVLNSCILYHLHHGTNTFLLHWRRFFVPHVNFWRIDCLKVKVVNTFWSVIYEFIYFSARYASFSPPLRQNILLLYFRLFAGVSTSPFLVFVDLSPKVKCEPLSTKSPSLQSRCSFMARIPSIRILFYHTRLSCSWGVF